MRAATWGLSAVALAIPVAAAYAVKEPPYASPHAGTMPPTAPSSVLIAPVTDALTFARYRENGSLRLMRVDGYAEGIVTGTLLDGLGAADPITLYGRHGYDALARATGQAVRLPDHELDVPFDGTGCPIAIGGNYPAHNNETDLVESFVFPKVLAPGRFDADVPAGDGLLDHEVELGFVTLDAVPDGERPAAVGLLLVSDYTDRETLLREADLRNVSSGRGLVDAKSKPGYMPVGNLFVIPADVRRFYRDLTLRLYVDDVLRQVAPAGQMIWDVDEILHRSAAEGGRRWPFGDGECSLPIADGTIRARTIILSGTTDGVVFRPPSTRQRLLGGLEAVLPPWRDIRQSLLGPTIREAKSDRRYLQPGDMVIQHADHLGLIRNRIVR